jgi:signal peptidase I
VKKRNLKNWIPGLQVSAAISFLLFLYAPVDLYCANTAEFWFDFSTLLITALGMFAACFAVLAVLYLIAMLIHPYVYRITLAGGIALFICTYIQGNFMIDRLPPLDGTSIWWGKYDILRKDTLLLWVVVLIVVIAAMIVLRKQKFVHVVMFISGCMTLMLLVTACSTVITSGALHSKLHLHVSVEEEFEMSADNNFVVQLYFVNGSSMEPTYTSGQPVFLQKFDLPDCLDDNDVVVIRHETLGRDIVKRIVALPGDTVQITEGILYVNGVPQPTPDGFSLMEDAGNAAAPLTLAPGEYFVLGDNRNHSIDSRFAEVGIIPAASIAGKVIAGRTPFR